MKVRIIYLAIALPIGLLVYGSFSFGLFSGLENFFEDILFSQKPIRDEIIIIAIDNESIQRIGQWPWPREIFSQALLKINENPPASLGFDIMLSEPSRFGEKDDAFFSNSLAEISYPVILPVEVSLGNSLKPLPIFQNSKQTTLGSVNLISDRDNIVRKFPHPSFAYETTKNSGLNIPNENNLENINRIVFSAPPGFIRKIPFWRILEDDISEQLAGKIIFIGATAPDLHDSKPTPFTKGVEMSGVEIHAQIANMLLSGHRLVPLGNNLSFFWIILAAILPAFIPLLGNIILGLLYLLIAIILFQKGIAINILHINFSWILSTASLFSYKFFISEKEKREIKNVFSKYVSKDVLMQILQNPKNVTLGGEEKEITLLFCDIRGFTTLSEKTTPQELVRILNKYFSAMTEKILNNDGVLDKYIGDAIMAFWGAPVEDPNQADKALRASLEMIKQLNALNKELKENNDPEIKIGIGLYTGPAVVGNIGSELRFDYTAIGDTVNAASRLEGLTKEHEVEIILGENTKNKLKGNYNLKSLGQVSVKGRKESIKIYTPELELDSPSFLK